MRKVQRSLLLGSLLLLGTLSSAQYQYADVPEGHWAYEATKHLLESYILVSTMDSGKFLGNLPFSRYEFAMWLDRLNVTVTRSFTNIQCDFPTGRSGAVADSGGLDLRLGEVRSHLATKAKRGGSDEPRRGAPRAHAGERRRSFELETSPIGNLGASLRSTPAELLHTRGVVCTGGWSRSLVLRWARYRNGLEAF